MREFLLFSRTGFTSGNFNSLMEGGRLDIVYQCALMSLFKSQAHRNDAVFHAVLNGPPRPPIHLEIRGDSLRDAHIDESSWETILRNVLRGKPHPGITVDRTPLQRLVQDKAKQGYKVFALERGGEPVEGVDLSGDALFVLGDHIGLPKKDEGFVLRYGRKLSLGREKYLAASSIDILNYMMDRAVP
jgi:tRNA pseudouridine-54 N-methylase